jgi:HD-GYP domain-containing protein (c-di-GMP phosphodiesterase class II)
VSTFKINLHEVTYSLSDALDLVGVTHIHHGKRVAYMAAECGKHLGWQGQRLDDLFQAAVLHDCGVSKTSIHSRLTQLQWENEKDHCEIGANLLKSSPLLSKLSDIVRHHHTHWAILKDLDLPMETKLSANCIYLVDRVDVLTLASLKDQSNILLGREATLQKILDNKGEWFCPELVDAFLQISHSEAFWFRLESEHVDGYTATWIAHDQYREVEFSELRSLFHIFSVIVDAKSQFTREHSDGVASLSRFIGELFQLSERCCEMLELAGLLHDLGKLKVPDEFLEKPGKLTHEEYATVQRHSFDTFNILKTIHGLQEIADWAAQHHERVDGSGYPYHLSKDGISIEARIMAVADVFQALAQKRPYRDQLPPAAILRILQEQVANGKLDAEVVACVENHLQECWKAALVKP